MKKNIPVYLFTGFLDAGKTRFIQETLEDKRFNKGEKTLLLLCEEGEEEYDPSRFSGSNVFIETLDDPEQLSSLGLIVLLDNHNCERLMVEYNGMWNLSDLYDALPDGWYIAQEFFFADAGSIMTYNANMRNLVADKLKNCELVVFNRWTSGTDQMPFHQLVRTFNRRCDIAYETADGEVSYDEIRDPLPFDRDADEVEIPDDAFALWYRDMTEELSHWDGRTVTVLGRSAGKTPLGGTDFVFGREVMTCCAADVQFAGVICRVGKAQEKPAKYSWLRLTGRIAVQKHSAYKGMGPVLTVLHWESAEEPLDPVATFY